jgi:hypothetical protein
VIINFAGYEPASSEAGKGTGKGVVLPDPVPSTEIVLSSRPRRSIVESDRADDEGPAPGRRTEVEACVRDVQVRVQAMHSECLHKPGREDQNIIGCLIPGNQQNLGHFPNSEPSDIQACRRRCFKAVGPRGEGAWFMTAGLNESATPGPLIAHKWAEAGQDQPRFDHQKQS